MKTTLTLLSHPLLQVREECSSTRDVFPNPRPVMLLFIQRIFEQRFQMYLESSLKKAKSVSELEYLRTLCR